MNIEGMTDHEKTVLLAKAMKESMLPKKYLTVMSPEFQPINLYSPANMALAWRVLNWFDMKCSPKKFRKYHDKFQDWWDREYIWGAEDAQRLWLDKILSLAIEAGKVDWNRYSIDGGARVC